MEEDYRVQGQDVDNYFKSKDDLIAWISDSVSICENALLYQAKRDGWPDTKAFDKNFTVKQDKWDLSLILLADTPKETE